MTHREAAHSRTRRTSHVCVHRIRRLVILGLVTAMVTPCGGSEAAETSSAEAVTPIDPPERGFFSKQLDYEGIPIKTHRDVVDEALHAARQRLGMMLGNLPSVRERLRKAGAELHIIGRNQVTSDLPDYRHLRGKPFAGGQTVDERTRGFGGLRASCGEENLLKLPEDPYRGRDICVHEFAHTIFDYGMTPAVRKAFREQYRRSLDRGLWAGAYAATSADEFFAELSMWYFGTHGDLRMDAPPPGKGPKGLKAYDPEAYEWFDRFYRGRLERQICKRFRAGRRWCVLRPTSPFRLPRRSRVRPFGCGVIGVFRF